MKFIRSFALPAALALAGAFAPIITAPSSAAPSTPAPAVATAKAPFPYVWGTAHHVMPETHTDESGYFSIAEGLNGKIYVGTAKYDYNAFLVEFDPKTGKQRIVIDTHKLNNLKDVGYASQSKIHTRNFVAPSGRIYVGSQEGYRRIKDDNSVYPGGYVMVFDPNTDKAETLGMPMKGEGVIDVVADEARGIMYVVTTWGDDKKSHWLIGDIKNKTYRDLGVNPTNYASTLMDAQGRAHVITEDSRLATYDPKTNQVSIRDIEINGAKWTRTDGAAIPTWQLTPDRKGAYLILMNDSALYKFDWSGTGAVKAEVLGRLIEGKGYDSRSSLTVAPDGRVYALVKVDNQTGFGSGYLHHLTRYDPKTKRTEDMGVLAVRNPSFFNFGPRADGIKPPWSHGYHTLPDGTMTPLHGHQGLIAARNGDIYALILYPFTILRMEGVGPAARNRAVASTRPAANNARPVSGTFALPKPASPSQQYASFALRALDNAERNLSQITPVAELVAQRHTNGGMLGFNWNSQSLQQELAGRAGGLMHIDFPRTWQGRSPEGDKHNVAIIGWDRAPNSAELSQMQKLKEAGTYIVGFGPRGLPELAEHIKLCDAFFDTGLGADDRVVVLPNGQKVGRGNALVNMMNGWAFIGEVVAALTRKGKMPPIWKAWMYANGKEWSDKYFQKSQFHEDFKVAPIAPGVLPRAFFTNLRENIRRFHNTQNAGVLRAAQMIADESNAGRKTIISAMGHAPWTYVGHYEDRQWGVPFELESTASHHVEAYKKTPEGALVLRLGYGGMDDKAAAIYAGKKQRVILISVPDERADFQATKDVLMNIDMGWQYGDATVSIPGYPVKLFPPSGIMQIVAYESVNTETLARLRPVATP